MRLSTEIPINLEPDGREKSAHLAYVAKKRLSFIHEDKPGIHGEGFEPPTICV